MAIVFIALGSLILRGSGEALSSSGAAFASQVIGMYTTTLGEWAFVIVATAAFTTMFSTTLTVLDAFPRVLDKAIGLSVNKAVGKSYVLLLMMPIIGALTVLFFLMENMKQLIDFATSISFITAPILAFLMILVCYNNKAVLGHYNKAERLLALTGLGFLLGFSMLYLYFG